MPYVTMAEMKAIVPPEILTAAVDDGNYGADVDQVWDVIADAASRRVNSILGSRYPVPFSAPYPDLVHDAAVIFAAHMLYLRRQSGDKNPYAAEATDMMARLQRVADGLSDLTAADGAADAVAITEESKTYQAGGRLML